MIPEWIAVLYMVFAYVMGAVTWYAIAMQDRSLFWAAFLDGLTLRRLWDRK